MIRVLAIVLGLVAGAVQADAPTSSARPLARFAAPVAEARTAEMRPVARHSAPVMDSTVIAALAVPVSGVRPQLGPMPAPQSGATAMGIGAAKAVLAPMGFVEPTSLAVVVSARPAPRGGVVAATGPGYETITDLIAEGSLSATADVPLVSFMAKAPGGIIALAPSPSVEATTAPMGLLMATPLAIGTSARPQARVREDRSFVTRPEYRADQNVFAFSPLAIPLSLRPLVRPAALTRQVEEARAAVVRGSVCGDPAIQGEAIGDVPGPGTCGIDNAVRLRSVLGITFGGETPRVDCTTARALKRWIERGAIPTIGTRGGGLSQLSIMGTYSCRNRNGAGSGRISEHAFGKAFDIGGFKLRDGTSFTVLRDWGTRAWGETLRALHDKACGPFGTVLGPNANAAHRNHFHFDTAAYRSGSYCR